MWKMEKLLAEKTMFKTYSINTNWQISHGTEIENCLSVEQITEDSLAKTANIDDITGSQRVVLLTKSTATNQENSQNACHVKLKTGLQHATPLISLLCDCNKIELFTGISEEYVNVYYGELLDEFDGAKSYIFEFKFPKNVTELLLKFITNEEQIWIYGIHMYLIEIPFNFFQTQSSINIDNVQNYLSQSNQNLSSNAEKCKEFITMHINSANGKNAPPNMAALMSFINEKIKYSIESSPSECTSSSSPISDIINQTKSEQNGNADDIINNVLPELHQSTSAKSTKTTASHQMTALETGIDMAKLYIDKRMMKLEENLMKKINERFDEIAKRQNEQFELIMATLAKKS